MQPPIKDQGDIGIEDVTLDASDSEDNKDMARQEFKNEADINYMLSRFGVTSVRGAPTYGEWNDAIDLQNSLEAVRDARTAYRRLPIELRDKFRSMEELIEAVENGSLKIKEDGEIKPVTAPVPQSPAGPA